MESARRPVFLFMCFNSVFIYRRQEKHTFKYAERVHLNSLRACGAPSSGPQPWMGGPPHIAAYRFWYPRMRSQRSSINLFCDNHLHISPGKLDQTEKTPHGAGNQHRADWSGGKPGPVVPPHDPPGSRPCRQDHVVCSFILKEWVEPGLSVRTVSLVERLALTVRDFSSPDDPPVPRAPLPR